MQTDEQREYYREAAKLREDKQRDLGRKQWKAWTDPADKAMAVSFVNFLNDRRESGLPELGDSDLMLEFIRYRK